MYMLRYQPNRHTPHIACAMPSICWCPMRTLEYKGKTPCNFRLDTAPDLSHKDITEMQLTPERKDDKMIRNHNRQVGHHQVTAGKLFRCWTFAIGFNDRMLGNVFDARYSSWPRREQSYYESGRLIGANNLSVGCLARLITGKLKPAWYAKDTNLAVELVGSAKPDPVTAPKHEPEIECRLAPPVKVRSRRTGKVIWLPGPVPTFYGK